LTASHVVYSSTYGSASNIVVTPAYDAGAAPFGSVTGAYAHYFPVNDALGLISQADTQDDFAVIHLSQPLDVGWMGLAADFAGGTVHVTGYPGSGQGLMVDTVQPVFLDPGYSVYVGTSLGPGSSGGPVWVAENGQDYVVGTVSSGEGSTGYFGQITDAILGQIESWVAQDDAVTTAVNAALLFAYAEVTAPVAVADTANAVVNALPTLEAMAVAGDLKTITLTDGGTPQLTLSAQAAAADAAALHAIASPFLLDVTGTSASIAAFLAKEDVAGRGLNGIAADYAGQAPAGGNSVVGFQSASFTSGYDAVVLDGPRSSYAIQVDAAGSTTIQDIGADASHGQTVTVSGESYLIFSGGASSTIGGLPVYSSMYLIANPADAQLAQFYAAATQFQGQVPLSGLEYWENQLAAGMPLAAIAQSFIDTSYFQSTFGDPGTTHDEHVSYVEQLYKNILKMNVDATNSGVAYWAGQMDSGTLSGAVTLLSFTNAAPGASPIDAMPGATAGAGSGWLIDPAAGGYADPASQTPTSAQGQSALVGVPATSPAQLA
jgi:hypothetical protein